MTFGKPKKGQLEGVNITDDMIEGLMEETGADFILVMSLKHGEGISLTTKGSVSDDEKKGLIKALKDTASILSDDDKLSNFTA